VDPVQNDRRSDGYARADEVAYAPPSKLAATQATLVAIEPWADAAQFVPDPSTTYAAKFFSNRAYLAGAVLRPSPAPSTVPAAHTPSAALSASPDALHGVLLAADEPSLPPTTRADLTRGRYAGDYRLYPQVQTDSTGTARVAYWSAYNTKEKRTDFYVGPDKLDAFQDHPYEFADVAARVPQAGLQDWDVESSRTVGAILAGQPGQAAQHFARAWGDAVSNPRFIENTVANAILGLDGGAALDELNAAREIEGMAARSRLVRGSTEVGPGGVGLHEYRPNADGAVRSVEQARAIARSNGVDLPDWMEIHPNPKIPIDEKFAAYRLGGKAPPKPMQFADWDRLAPDGVVVVNVHPSVFESDEAIVGVLAHESHELTSLHAGIEQNGPMRYREVESAINASGSRNLHGQAWDIADYRVMQMRSTTEAGRAEIERRITDKMKDFDKANGIER
jgi:hypothetical protein